MIELERNVKKDEGVREILTYSLSPR